MDVHLSGRQVMCRHRLLRRPGKPSAALAAAWLVVGALALGEEPKASQSAQVFQQHVLPLLEAACFECHGNHEPKGGLSLLGRSRILQGGDSGAAVAPGSAATSLLIERVESGEMPPDPRKKLSAEELRVLREWIDGGAAAPDVIAADPPSSRSFTPEERGHWAFQPLRRPAPPQLEKAPGIANPIDAFLLATLREHRIDFSEEAAPAALLRRVFFDLIGLPPSPEELEEFLHDPSERAYESVVDRLLASPHFGERWGRHWLDGAGYVDVLGGDNDAAIIKTGENKWLYRDYVVDSLNADKPFARFLTEQIAGDELVDWRTAPVFTPEIRELLVATGFLRTSADDTAENELNTLDIRYGVLHRTTETIAGNLLGLTLQCAKCHDHKYEPITQRDYYRFEALLQPALNPQNWLQPQARQLPAISAAEKAAIENTLAQQQAAAPAEAKPAWPHWQVLYDAGPPTPTYILRRGDPFSPGEEVPAGFFSILSPAEEATVAAPSHLAGATSGRRLALAQWLTDAQLPAGGLVIRVRVNRVWQHLFGIGLVATPENFGLTGAASTHPELLEWLAREFAESDGRLKPLVRIIVLSRAYRQTSAERQPAALAADPENRLLWRQRLRRLESEAIRDSILAASGVLARRLGGAPLSVEPRPDGAFVVKDEGAAAFRRSLYLLARRNYHPTVLSVFDQPHLTTQCTRRETSAVVLQSLTMLNDAFVMEQASLAADRVLRETGMTPVERVHRAFTLILGRRPEAEETAWCVESLEQDAARSAKRRPEIAPEDAVRESLGRLCQTLFNTSEFLYVP
jgi:hypothetical protein